MGREEEEKDFIVFVKRAIKDVKETCKGFIMAEL